MTAMTKKQLLLLTLLLVLVALFLALDLGQYLTLEQLKVQQQQFAQYYAAQPVLVIGIFFLGYVLITGLSLPGAAIMTLAAGALFGLWTGTLVVSFASTLGATLAFLFSRLLLRDWVQRKFTRSMETINAGIAQDGARYLFSLRLVPVIPFFVINLVMGLTQLRVWTFYWVSQLGMLAGTLVYVNAGSQLAQLESMGGLLSPSLLGAFLLLASFPWLARGLQTALQHRARYRHWRKPKRFDRNLIVIGAGAAGLVSAYIAATVRAGVTLIEQDRMGGDCLNTGCVPSKTLIKTASLLAQTRDLARYGIQVQAPALDFPALMARIRAVIKDIEPHDSVARYSAMGVDCQHGQARLLSPWEVEIRSAGTTKRLTSRAIILATGARPQVPALPGLAQIAASDQLTSETLWTLDALPAQLLVLGGGPVGCELAQSFARLGSQVTLLQRNARLLPRDEPEASALVTAALQRDGVQLHLQTQVERFARETDADGVVRNVLYAKAADGSPQRISFDKVLLALGRSANTQGLGLEALGIATREDGTLVTNAWLQTSLPNIYACGDVAGPFQFTHAAAHQAWYAAVNALFGLLRKFKADYRVLPWTTFTDPEVAHVGLTCAMADAAGMAYEVTDYALADLDRAIADGNTQGFVKVLTAPGSDRILGVTIAAAEAGNLLQEFVLAMQQRIGLEKILGTIHAYPTLVEANKYAAGEWKKARKPEALLAWVARFHRWRRGH